MHFSLSAFPYADDDDDDDDAYLSLHLRVCVSPLSDLFKAGSRSLGKMININFMMKQKGLK